MRLHISWPLILTTLERFTLSFLCGLVALGLIVYANHNPLFSEQPCFFKILVTLGVFAPLIASAERAGVMKGSSKIRIIGSMVLLILGAIYGWVRLPENASGINQDRYAVQIAIHAILARTSLLWIVPALMKWHAKDTRAHVYKLIIETIVTGIFCGALFGGLAAALGAIDYLFGITIPSERYSDLAAIIFLGFGTLFWLSHLASTPTVYTFTTENFPKVLRIFAEFILGFLLLIYAGIILAYTGKILISGVWPNGMIASLIFGFVGMGMVYSAILLPRTVDTTRGHLRSRLLGGAFILCAILLVAALHLRVMEYGWTVKRTFVVLIGVWMVILAISLLLVKPSFKRWFISASLLALIGLYGPVNVFNVAKNDQLARLTGELAGLGIAQPGDRATNTEPTKITQNISSRVDYLLRYHGTGALAKLVSPDAMVAQLDEANNPGGEKYAAQDVWTIGTAIVNSWGLAYEPNAFYSNPDGVNLGRVNFYGKRSPSLSLDGYTTMFNIEAYNGITADSIVTGSNETSAYQLDLIDLTLSVGGAESISLAPLIEQAKNERNEQQHGKAISEPLMLTGSNFALYVTALNGEYGQGGTGTGFHLTNIEGMLLVR